MRTFILSLIFFCAAIAQGKDQTPVHGYTDAQIAEMAAYNKSVMERQYANPLDMSMAFRTSQDRLPYAEFEEAGYLVFSDDYFSGMARHIKIALAENLPEDVTLVIFTDSNSKSYHQKLINEYTQYVAADKFKVLKVENRGNYFWARDGLPVPTWNNVSSQPTLGMVDAKYYHNFEGDKGVSEAFGADLVEFGYYFEGGNFIVNTRGDCLIVNRVRPPSITGNIPDQAFITSYGCKRLIRLPWLKGIGHADEVVKFMTDDLVFTDTHEYVETLEQAGFEVRMLPEPDYKYETYINSLQVNDIIYVPTFGESGDQPAIKAYADLGLTVVPINTRDLATRGQGGIHCITMTYPPGPFHEVVRQMKAEVIH